MVSSNDAQITSIGGDGCRGSVPVVFVHPLAIVVPLELVVRPQFNAQAICIARISGEVNRITHQGRKELTWIAVEVLVLLTVGLISLTNQPLLLEVL